MKKLEKQSSNNSIEIQVGDQIHRFKNSSRKNADELHSTNKYKVSKEMSSTLSKISKKVRKDADTRKGLDKLAKQLGNGELHAGRGAKKLPGTETVFYMRSGGEARLFFKYADKDKGVIHVIAESDKDNETKVMDNIRGINK
jgi:mRNA-degrading endonuclease RelE of RelBE toxin-antitoxin system